MLVVGELCHLSVITRHIHVEMQADVTEVVGERVAYQRLSAQCLMTEEEVAAMNPSESCNVS